MNNVATIAKGIKITHATTANRGIYQCEGYTLSYGKFMKQFELFVYGNITYNVTDGLYLLLLGNNIFNNEHNNW